MPLNYINKSFVLARRTPVPPKMRLLIFPHAGGSPSFYKHWGNLVPDFCEAWIAAYPGREARHGEAYATSIQELAYQAIESCEHLKPSLKLVIYGHSMGAVVAYEFLRALKNTDLPMPLLLCVSGRSHLVSLSKQVDNYLMLGNRDLLKALNNDYGGIPEAIFESLEFIDLIADGLRSDINIAQSYNPVNAEKIDCNIANLKGSKDSSSTVGMYPWNNLTSMAYIERTYDGGHFFIKENASRIISDIFSFAHAFAQQ